MSKLTVIAAYPTGNLTDIEVAELKQILVDQSFAWIRTATDGLQGSERQVLRDFLHQWYNLFRDGTVAAKPVTTNEGTDYDNWRDKLNLIQTTRRFFGLKGLPQSIIDDLAAQNAAEKGLGGSGSKRNSSSLDAPAIF